MSLINDALLKAERDRADAAVAEAARLTPLARAEKLRAQRQQRSLRPILVNATLLAALFAAVILLLLRPGVAPTSAVGTGSADPTVANEAPIAVVERPAPEEIVAPAAESSPFAPPVTSEPVQSPPTVDYALAGMTVLGRDTLISVLRRSDQRSVWIPVGKTVGEVTAVSYNADQDQATIRVAGQLHTISMGSAAPAAVQPAE